MTILTSANIFLDSQSAIPILVAVLAVLCLIVAVVLIHRQGKQLRAVQSQRLKKSDERSTEPSDMLPRRIGADDPTAPLYRLGDKSPYDQVPTEEDDWDGRLPPPSSQDALQAEEEGDFIRAAIIWRKRSDIVAERRALAQSDNMAALAQIDLALGNTTSAQATLLDLLREDPTDLDVRTQCVQTLLDLGEIDKAVDMAGQGETLEASTTPQRMAKYARNMGRAFEAKGELPRALHWYEVAVRHEIADDSPIRLTYLRLMMRLATDEETRRHAALGRQQLSEKLGANAPASFVSEEDELPDDAIADEPWKPHEVIVGHLAFGGVLDEIPFSVRSQMSLASRFDLVRLIGERETSAIFEGRDRILDCPVALRLTRVPSRGVEYDILRTRMRSIAQLNHPNLSKTTFADRHGRIVRIVTEFHSGGNLPTLLKRLDKVGLPLALRVLIQVGSALEYSHQHALVHGDLRLENVMVGHDNLVKLVDFDMRPWPVRVASANLGEPGTSGLFPTLSNAEAQHDLAQFADVIEQVLAFVDGVPPHLASSDPLGELRELVTRARTGAFSTVIPINRILTKVLEQVVPGSVG